MIQDASKYTDCSLKSVVWKFIGQATQVKLGKLLSKALLQSKRREPTHRVLRTVRGVYKEFQHKGPIPVTKQTSERGQNSSGGFRLARELVKTQAYWEADHSIYQEFFKRWDIKLEQQACWVIKRRAEGRQSWMIDSRSSSQQPQTHLYSAEFKGQDGCRRQRINRALHSCRNPIPCIE